jgi:hypothetical protein
LCVTFALFLLPYGLSAQTIRGELVDKTTGQPLGGGFVMLLDEDSNEIDRSLTDASGRFTVAADEGGRFRLKSAVIGIKSTVTPPFDLLDEQELELSFAVQAIVIVLPKVVVEDERVCRGPDQAGLAAAIVWEEARKALDAVRWTEHRGMFHHNLVRYERRLDPYSLKVLDNRGWSQSGMYRGSPFETESPDVLAAAGFIQRDEQEHHYYGPDANVLLSGEFAGGHCFSIREGEREQFGLVGLEFSPSPATTVPDISGVLWLDRATAELRHLDFRYTHVPHDVDSPMIGGRVVFERLPDGSWIVQRWRIRMPVVRTRPARYSDFTTERYLAEIRESGGWVSEIHTADGMLVGRVGGAMLVGTAVDLNNARPVAGATVVVMGTDLATRTDREGRFRFERIPEGRYRVAFGSDVLDSRGFAPPHQYVNVSLDQPQTVGLAIPRFGSLRSLLCPDSDPVADDVGIVSGFVRDLSGNALGAVQVIALERRPGAAHGDAVRLYGDAMTDWSGFYSVCDVPAGGTVAVEARLAGRRGTSTRTATTRLTGGEIVRIDFALNAVER